MFRRDRINPGSDAQSPSERLDGDCAHSEKTIGNFGSTWSNARQAPLWDSRRWDWPVSGLVPGAPARSRRFRRSSRGTGFSFFRKL